jgi:hypothetical protein
VRIQLKELDKVKTFEEDKLAIRKAWKIGFLVVFLLIWTVCFVILLISPQSIIAEKFQAFAVNFPWEILSSLGN